MISFHTDGSLGNSRSRNSNNLKLKQSGSSLLEGDEEFEDDDGGLAGLDLGLGESITAAKRKGSNSSSANKKKSSHTGLSPTQDALNRLFDEVHIGSAHDDHIHDPIKEEETPINAVGTISQKEDHDQNGLHIGEKNIENHYKSTSSLMLSGAELGSSGTQPPPKVIDTKPKEPVDVQKAIGELSSDSSSFQISVKNSLGKSSQEESSFDNEKNNRDVNRSNSKDSKVSHSSAGVIQEFPQEFDAAQNTSSSSNKTFSSGNKSFNSSKHDSKDIDEKLLNMFDGKKSNDSEGELKVNVLNRTGESGLADRSFKFFIDIKRLDYQTLY